MPTLTSSCDGNILCFKRIKNEGGEGVSGERGVREEWVGGGEG